jgi:carboxymethylenebutenolidase
MCHPEAPAGAPAWNVTREEVELPLADGPPMPALLTRPLSGGGPAVLIAHDIWGRSPFYEDIAARLAVAGFVALLPDYFAHVSAGPIARGDYEAAFGRRNKVDERVTIAQLGESLVWLQTQRGVTGSKVGLLGFCMGGTLVLDIAATRGDLATASYYAFPAGEKRRAPTHPTPPIELADHMRGPIIAFWGDQDPLVDMADIERFRRALMVRGVAIDVTIYPGLEHGFLGASRLDPNHSAYVAACDAWTKTLGFFWKELRPSESRQTQSAGSP